MIVIETSTERAIVALFKEGNLASLSELPSGLTSSKHLITALQTVIGTHQIDLVISGVGPGSYTGIRVGASIAKAYAFARRLPIVGVCSLEGFQPFNDGSFAAVIDAKISGVYIRFGVKNGESVTWEDKAQVLSLEDAADRLLQVEYAVTSHKEVLQQKLPHPGWIERYPDPLAIYKAGIQSVPRLDYSLELQYLRKTQAEIELISSMSGSFPLPSGR